MPGPFHMILVTRLNGTAFTLNALYIEKVESFPDTTITLTTGTKYIVLDSADEVVNRITKFYQAVQVLSNPHFRGENNEE
jgi:flagellar protein FlbD